MVTDFKAGLKQYLRHFMVGFIIVAVMAAVFLFLYIRKVNKPSNMYESPNTERVYGSKRVFDNADVLTAEQEASLEDYIHNAERLTCADIVIVTLNESLADYEPEYRAGYDIEVTPDKYVMVYADKFWEDNKFGYDCPQVLDGTTATGDGVILVDNLFREPETGKIYTWMGTTGKAEDYYSDYQISYRLDNFYDYVDTDYYRACTRWVDGIIWDLSVDEEVDVHYPVSIFGIIPIIVGAIVSLCYFASNTSERVGKTTTTSETYLVAEPSFPVKTDTFLRSDVRKVYNPPSESSRSGGGGGGGGGHHSSGGGGSHGGGGHSR
jgi:uncharacterized protein